jgi:CBS domain containing-hemolysin-like protein
VIALVITIVVLLAVLTVYSYIDRIYGERGKFLDRQFQQTLDNFEQVIEPRLGMSRERATLASALWMELSLIAVGSLTTILVIVHTTAVLAVWVEAAVFLALVVIFCNRVVPYLLFTRTRGLWLATLTPLLRMTLLAMLPISIVLGFCLSLASLSEAEKPADPEEQRESEIEALVEAGAEEGIIEEHERDLVQSALEFGDKRVREVMVPRPDIIALPANATLAHLRELLRQRHIARIPVYTEDIDHIVGVVNTHELLHVSEKEMTHEMVASRLRPVPFVPESKSTAELLREMQQDGSQMAIVVNEYGAVAGLVTLDDLVEEIVGEIHDDAGEEAEWVEQAPGEFVVSGGLDLDRLQELAGLHLDSREATTVAGLLAELMGRIPHAGESIDADGAHFDVLEANETRILRVRVTAQPHARANGAGAADHIERRVGNGGAP